MGKAGRVIKSRTTFGQHERGFARVHSAESTILTENAGRLAMKRLPTLPIFHEEPRYFPAPGPLKYLRNSEFESSTITSLRPLNVAL